MRKGILILLISVLMIAAGILLTACGQQNEENGVEGSWQLTELQLREKHYTLDELAKTVDSDKGDETVLILDVNADGGFTLHRGDLSDKVAEGSCNQTEDGWIFALNEQQEVTASIEGNRLILHDTLGAVESKMIFVRK